MESYHERSDYIITNYTKSDLRLLDDIPTYGSSNPQYRQIREWIEELTEEGIFFIPSGTPFVYRRIEMMNTDAVNKYIWIEIKRAASIFKRIWRLRKYLSEKQKRYIYYGGLFKGDEINQ